MQHPEPGPIGDDPLATQTHPEDPLKVDSIAIKPVGALPRVSWKDADAFVLVVKPRDGKNSRI